jgi:DNA invertase Pin-like site-specific DNA recombinase
VRSERKAFGQGDSVSQLRCAIYARYSTDKQNPLSIDGQIRRCREFASRRGWEALDGISILTRRSAEPRMIALD